MATGAEIHDALRAKYTASRVAAGEKLRADHDALKAKIASGAKLTPGEARIPRADGGWSKAWRGANPGPGPDPGTDVDG